MGQEDELRVVGSVVATSHGRLCVAVVDLDQIRRVVLSSDDANRAAHQFTR
jgi:hypothetical protein